MTRPSTIAVVAGALGAVLLVAAMQQSLFGVVLGAMLSPLPLAMAVLGLGVNVLPLAVVSGAVTVTVLTGSFALAFAYLIMDAIPVAVFSRLKAAAQAENGTAFVSGASIGRIVCLLTVGITAVLVLSLALIPAGPEGIEASLRERLEEVLKMVAAANIVAQDGMNTPEDRAELLRVLAGVLPAALAIHWTLRSILSTGLAHIALKRMDLADGLTPDFRKFELPNWFVVPMGVLLAVALVAGGNTGFVAASAAAVLSLPVALQGLAVVHEAAAQTRHRVTVLIAFYVLALLMASAAVVMLVTLGLAEQIFKIRTRHFAAGTGGE